MLPSKLTQKLPGLFALLAGIGFADATYLTVEHYLGAIPPCVVSKGCSVVLTSKWSEVAGIPVALMGAVFYLFLLTLSLIYFRTKNVRIIRFAALATVVDVAVSAFFVSIQLFVLKQVCFYCMVSAVVSAALFVVGMFIFFGLREKSGDQESLPS